MRNTGRALPGTAGAGAVLAALGALGLVWAEGPGRAGAGSGVQEPAPFREAAELAAADRAFAAASRERGVEAWVDVWAPDGRLGDAPPDAAVGRGAVRAALSPLLERHGDRFRWEPDDARWLWPDSLGYTTGSFRIDGETGRAPVDGGRYLTVWRRTDDGWKVALDMSVPTSASEPGAHDFDFWIGDWSIRQRVRTGDGPSFEGYPARTQVRTVGAGGVVAESWRGVVRFEWQGMASPAQIRGASIRVYDPATGTWRIFWIDTLQHAFGEPYVGRFDAEGDAGSSIGVFERVSPLPDGRTLRITFRRPDRNVVDWTLTARSPEQQPRTLWSMRFERP